MSRVGKKVVECPDAVDVVINGSDVNVKGPKGELSMTIDPRVEIKKEDAGYVLSIASTDKALKAKHGLYRALLANMIEGVSKGYEQNLELFGIGYRVQLKGSDLNFSLGYSHEVVYNAVPGIKFEVEGTTKIKITGIDKQLVGQTVANIRKLRRPDSYKGKGVRLAGEQLILKPGKSVKK